MSNYANRIEEAEEKGQGMHTASLIAHNADLEIEQLEEALEKALEWIVTPLKDCGVNQGKVEKIRREAYEHLIGGKQ